MRRDSIQSILNNLAGTGIYVIRQDNHKILYFNDRVKEVAPGVKVGDICHELWAGSCENCPLPELKDKEAHQSVNYNDPFGEVVDIAATRMLWEDKIPAFLISVTPHTLTELEKKEADRKKYLAAATKRVYMLIASVNLVSGTYEVITCNSDYLAFISKVGSYDELIKKGIATIHPAYTKAFQNTFSRKNLIAKLLDGEEVQLEFKQFDTQEKYHWKLMQVLRLTDDSGKEDAILMLSHIDRRKEMEREWEAFNHGVTKLFGECMLLNLEDGTYTTPKYDAGTLKFPMAGDFEDTNTQYGERLIHPDDREAFREAFSLERIRQRVAAGVPVISRELRRLNPDGSYHFTELLAVPTDSHLQEEQTVVLTFRDVDKITREEERKRKALLDALSLAEQANNAKTDFLSRMSHDIRTPMNAIIGMTAIAEANVEKSEKVQDCLSKIKLSARFLLSLINDILDMSKIESGKMVLSKEAFDLRKLINDLVDIAGPQIYEKNQTFTVTLGDNLEKAYFGDVLRLNQVLMNLLSNAVKYTPEGGTIALLVNQKRESDKKTVVHFEIKDNGIGMSETLLERIYTPFEQGHIKPIGMEGTGLGLSITRNLVHLMGGSISVESTPGKGSCFSVELPFFHEWHKASPEAINKKAADKSEVDQLSVEGMKALVVEDNPLNQEIAESLFEMEGFLVEIAENGEEALRQFEESPEGYYQLILMDIQMPFMDGLEATRKIRRLGRSDAAGVPIFAMTANAFSEDVAAAKAAGMTSHIAKPIDMSLAMAEIRRVLGGK